MRARRLHPWLAASVAGLLAGWPAASRADDPREAGEALRGRLLAAGPRAELAGTLRLRVHVGQGLPMGALVLRTDLVTRDEEVLYRITDRLNLDIPGLGSARLRVEADLAADLSARRVVLETEEPRGGGTLARRVVLLERGGEGWTRSVTLGYGEPAVEAVDLDPAALVLTPPVGAGERLTRLLPADLGGRFKLPAYDLETGLRTAWRASVEEPSPLTLAGEAMSAVRVVRQEGAARLEVLRAPGPGGDPLRVTREGEGRLLLLDPRLAPSQEPASVGPAVAVLALLRAATAGDRQRLLAVLDVDACYRAAGGGEDAAQRRLFEEVLLERFLDPQWLEQRGLLMVAGAATPGDLQVEGPAEGPCTVAPRGGGPGFRVARSGEGWRVVGLPQLP